jgi:hypothetical protein
MRSNPSPKVDFSFFAALAECSASFRHINLYIHSEMDTTHAEVFVSLLAYGGLMALVEQGLVVIHLQQTAPGNSQFVE